MHGVESKNLESGDDVIIHDLKTPIGRELNGRCGKLDRFDEAENRWEVHLMHTLGDKTSQDLEDWLQKSNESIEIKPENLLACRTNMIDLCREIN
eukprot:UN12493